MAKDFPTPHGKTAGREGRDPKSYGKPSAGITNDTKGNQAPKGQGTPTTASSKRIR